jgi:hypothetical protein
VDAQVFVAQLEQLISDGEKLMSKSKYNDLSDLKTVEVVAFVTQAIASINRIAGPNNTYIKELERYFVTLNKGWYFSQVPYVIGTLKALRVAIDSGFLITYQEQIHASMFSDFLEMGRHLLNDGYKDASAVLIGGVLEEQIRKLCVKNSISIEYADSQGNLRAKKTDTMNGELGNAGIYSKLDQKNVTAWLDLRNKAAHGKYGEYTQEQVEIFLRSVKNFMSRNPA